MTNKTNTKDTQLNQETQKTPSSLPKADIISKRKEIFDLNIVKKNKTN